MNECLHIALNIDKNYIMQAGVMMKSVCVNNHDNEICFHVIIDDSVSDEDKSDLNSVIDNVNHQIHYYLCDDNILSEYPNIAPKPGSISKVTYYRIFLTKYLPASIDKVLYLDADVIVRHSLKELWNTDISGYALGAVEDAVAGDVTKYNRLRYSPQYGYFNAGIILFNLRYWRENHCMEECINFISNHADRILYHDQDVLNYVFKDRKLDLPIKYNVQTSFYYAPAKQGIDYYKYEEEIIVADKDPTILHYTFKMKPWMKECRHPIKGEFFKYLAMTTWKDYKAKSSLTLHDNLRSISVWFGLLPKDYNEPFAETWYHLVES
jgi:lipopolysaccharide biosynthesis glycosyltransferase